MTIVVDVTLKYLKNPFYSKGRMRLGHIFDPDSSAGKAKEPMHKKRC